MLDPRMRESWQGFLDLLQPPAGFRLAAAVGTSFGLAVDVLTAALLSMSEADGEALAREPVAGVMAITRLRHKVRVLVHPGTISASPHAGSRRFVALLDRMIVEVQPLRGLFHPKVWALRFDRAPEAPTSLPSSTGRLVIGSRNLSASTAFELGAVFEGSEARGRTPPSPLAGDVADALQAWMAAGKVRPPEPVWRLPRFIRRLALQVPHEATEELRLHWQGPGRKGLADQIPRHLTRALVVSPFVQPDFVTALLERADELQLVSTPEALNGLDDDIYSTIEVARERQGSPVLYQVGSLGEDPDEGYIEGLHGKLLLTADGRGRTSSLLGSANATGPGWGLAGAGNVEAMVEMRPGIGIDRFVAGFVRESKARVHPWVAEYDRTTRVEPDAEREAERQVLAALRAMATVELRLEYDLARHALTVAKMPARSLTLLGGAQMAGLTFECAPLLLTDRPGAWTRLERLAEGSLRFDNVPLDKVTAFVALRARCKTLPVERTRLVLARLKMPEAVLDERDQAVRQDIMATADPAAVLAALVRGLAHLQVGAGAQQSATRQSHSVQRLLKDTSLESLLQAVAAEPGLIAEMRLLLVPAGGDEFARLCDDLETIAAKLETGAVS